MTSCASEPLLDAQQETGFECILAVTDRKGLAGLRQLPPQWNLAGRIKPSLSALHPTFDHRRKLAAPRCQKIWATIRRRN